MNISVIGKAMSRKYKDIIEKQKDGHRIETYDYIDDFMMAISNGSKNVDRLVILDFALNIGVEEVDDYMKSLNELIMREYPTMRVILLHTSQSEKYDMRYVNSFDKYFNSVNQTTMCVDIVTTKAFVISAFSSIDEIAKKYGTKKQVEYKSSTVRSAKQPKVEEKETTATKKRGILSLFSKNTKQKVVENNPNVQQEAPDKEVVETNEVYKYEEKDEVSTENSINTDFIDSFYADYNNNETENEINMGETEMVDDSEECNTDTTEQDNSEGYTEEYHKEMASPETYEEINEDKHEETQKIENTGLAKENNVNNKEDNKHKVRQAHRFSLRMGNSKARCKPNDTSDKENIASEETYTDNKHSTVYKNEKTNDEDTCEYTESTQESTTYLNGDLVIDSEKSDSYESADEEVSEESYIDPMYENEEGYEVAEFDSVEELDVDTDDVVELEDDVVDISEEVLERKTNQESIKNRIESERPRHKKATELDRVLDGRLRKVYVVTGDRGTGCTTLALEIANFYRQYFPVLYFDMDVIRHGLLNYIDYENFRKYPEVCKKSAVTICDRESTAKYKIGYAKNIDFLTSDYGTEYNESSMSVSQSIVASMMSDYNVIVADVPFEMLHLCEDLLMTREILVCCDPSLRGITNVAEFLDDSQMAERFKRQIFNNGKLVFNCDKKKRKDILEGKDILSSRVDFGVFNWLDMPMYIKDNEVNNEILNKLMEG